jgi:hypothetical protein
MKRSISAAILCALLVGIVGRIHAGNSLQPTQLSPDTLVGTWQSGSFAYTFFDNGTYVYVGAMGGAMMSTQIAEEGTYRLSGDALIVTRQRGVVTTSQNYRRDLEIETTVLHWRLGTMQGRPALQLIFPNGHPQMFYRQ